MYILEGKQKTRSSRGFKAAETVGFEPTCRLPDNLISSQARYDRFDTSPYLSIIKPGCIPVKYKCDFSLVKAHCV